MQFAELTVLRALFIQLVVSGQFDNYVCAQHHPVLVSVAFMPVPSLYP